MVPRPLLMHPGKGWPARKTQPSSGQAPQALTQVPRGLLCHIPGQHVHTPGASLSAPTGTMRPSDPREAQQGDKEPAWPLPTRQPAGILADLCL